MAQDTYNNFANGLNCWLRADALVQTNDVGLVTAWGDITGRGKNVTQILFDMINSASLPNPSIDIACELFEKQKLPFIMVRALCADE